MKETFDRLMTVKSLVTLGLTACFIVLALRGTIDQQHIMTIYTSVIAFYFGTQTVKVDKPTRGSINEQRGTAESTEH